MYKIVIVLLSVTFFMFGCDIQADTSEQGIKVQERTMQSAFDAVPVPNVHNFPTRDTIKRYMEHDNKPDQTHYVYVMLPGVGYVGYYVSDSAPVNICTSMTPTQREYRVGGQGSNPLGPAPGLDGVYYSGSSCDKWYFFDASTGAKIEIGGDMAFFVSSQPLALDVPQLTIRAKTE